MHYSTIKLLVSVRDTSETPVNAIYMFILNSHNLCLCFVRNFFTSGMETQPKQTDDEMLNLLPETMKVIWRGLFLKCSLTHIFRWWKLPSACVRCECEKTTETASTVRWTYVSTNDIQIERKTESSISGTTRSSTYRCMGVWAVRFVCS